MILGFLFGIGIYMLVTALTKDIKNDLITFNEMIQNESNRVELFKQLIDTIQLHSKVKRCAKQ